MFYFLMIINLLNSNVLNTLALEVKKKSPLIKELTNTYLSMDSLNNTVLGKYDYELFSNINYSNQDGAITGNFFLNNTEQSNFELGFRKYFSHGISTSISHNLNRINFSSRVIGSSGIFLPVTTFSISADLLSNFLGKKDKLELDNRILNNKKNYLELKDKLDQYYLNIFGLYLKAKTAKDQIFVANNLLKNTEDLLKVVKRKYSIGATEKRDLIYAKVNRKSSLETLFSTKRAYNDVVNNLISLSGFELNDFLDKVILESEIDNLVKQISIRFYKSTEIEILKQELEILKNGLRTSDYNLLPDLNFNASYSIGGDGNSFNSSYESIPNRGSFIGLSLSWPIENRANDFLHKSNLLKFKAINYGISNLEFSIKKDLEKLKNNLALFKEEKAITNEKVKENKERYKLELSAFNVGKSTINQVIDAQRDLTLSEAAFNSIKYDVVLNILNIAYKKGILMDVIFEE